MCQSADQSQPRCSQVHTRMASRYPAAMTGAASRSSHRARSIPAHFESTCFHPKNGSAAMQHFHGRFRPNFVRSSSWMCLSRTSHAAHARFLLQFRAPSGHGTHSAHRIFCLCRHSPPPAPENRPAITAPDMKKIRRLVGSCGFRSVSLI